jgi:phosphoenolpyruvate-protein phosphotransferase
MRKGVPVSPGVAVARAYCIDEDLSYREPQTIEASDAPREVKRFTSACQAAARELDAVINRVTQEVGKEAAAIFRAHRTLVRDPTLVAKVKSVIVTRHIDARSALQATLDEYTSLFNQIQDQYLRERMTDIRDIVGRILNHLDRQDIQQAFGSKEPVVLCAREILPSQAIAFDRWPLAGILTEAGGSTGHAAILARSLGIPAVSGLRGLLRDVKTGDLIAMDGREGHVYLNPGAEVEAAYRKLQREYVDLRDRLIENRDHEPITCDGERIGLQANVNSAADAVLAARVGATGVGLYRTEYLFLTHATVPDEEEQLAAYQQVVESAPNREVTIRTLDLGGDKHVPYLGDAHEANPFMGWRSIRLASAYPEFFQIQLRAILRAARAGKVSVLFPMVSTLEEIRQLKRMVDRARQDLLREHVPFGEDIRLGVMIEVPGAAICIESFLDEVDFVSIGSNDLIQYLMAADRDNPKVAHLCEPFGPALYKLLNHVLQACAAQHKPVTVCGEMAGRPRCLLPLLGMGLRDLSMSPAFIPSLKELVRSSRLDTARQVAAEVLKMTTFSEIRQYLTKMVHQVCPNVAMLDVHK